MFPGNVKGLLFCILLSFTHAPRASALTNDTQTSHHIQAHPKLERIPRNAFSHRFNSSHQFVINSREASTKNASSSSYRPKFAVPRDTELKFTPEEYMCADQFTQQCRNKTKVFRGIVTREFRRMMTLFEEKYSNANNYNVSFDNSFVQNKSICLSQFKVRTVTREDLTDSTQEEEELRKVLPKQQLFADVRPYATCAVVSSAGTLFNSKLGRFIDGHDLVMRFNHAPTEGYEEDVGTKTTIRIVNSQVVTKAQFDFLNNPLFRNISVAAWDPGRYKGSLVEWLRNPDFGMFDNYKRFRTAHPEANVHVIDPRSLWQLWETLQRYYPQQAIRQNPPSSGFVGIALLLPQCETIDVVEYIPSTRLTGRCHYYESHHNPMCTFGSWHPLAAEKLLMLDYNAADDYTTFQQGILRIKPHSYKC